MTSQEKRGEHEDQQSRVGAYPEVHELDECSTGADSVLSSDCSDARRDCVGGERADVSRVPRQRDYHCGSEDEPDIANEEEACLPTLLVRTAREEIVTDPEDECEKPGGAGEEREGHLHRQAEPR